MLTGIVTDTGHFKHASVDTFRTVAKIIAASGVEYGEVLDLMAATPQDISMRIAILKAASRVELDRVGVITSYSIHYTKLYEWILYEIVVLGNRHSNARNVCFLESIVSDKGSWYLAG